MTAPTSKLTSSPNFLKLWAAQTASVLGVQLTDFALPLTAALTLQATPMQMGILNALDTLPFLLFGLFAGTFVDRVHRRPIMARADFARAALLSVVPLAALLGMLRLEVLYVVAFLVGVATLLFDVAYQSFLPSVVRRDQLADANAKLETSHALFNVLGPSLGGGLVQLVTAPVALCVNAVAFVASAALLGGLRVQEAPPEPSETPRVWRSISEGVRFVALNPMLRAIAGCTSILNFFSALASTVWVLYVTRELGFQPALIGTVLGVGSAGAVLGAVLAAGLPRRLGVGRVIIGAAMLLPLAAVLVPLAPPGVIAPVLLAVAQFVRSFANLVYNVAQVSLRQALTPHRLLGRVNATMRFFVWGTMPLGALVGGVLGSVMDLRTTLLLAAAGTMLAVLPVLFSPVRTLRRFPEIEGDV